MVSTRKVKKFCTPGFLSAFPALTLVLILLGLASGSWLPGIGPERSQFPWRDDFAALAPDSCHVGPDLL